MKCKSLKVMGAKDIQLVTEKLEKVSGKTLVRVTRGGICGSDIHYYNEGGIGDFKVKHPMTLGHEVIGRIEETNEAVAINPSKPCGSCRFCLGGKSNQCLEMEFFGSAMRNPHVNGGFSEFIQVEKSQVVPYDKSVSDDVMAFSEPLAVALHAINQSGGVFGKKVMITGCGPIGCLIVAACRASGATEIIASDLSERCREMALIMGADKALDPNEGVVFEHVADKGYFDVAFEASGAIPALHYCIDATIAKGSLVLIGMRPGMVDIPLTKCLAKEIHIIGSFRFTSEFEVAVSWLERGMINPLPLLTDVMPVERAEEAILKAADKTKSMKVQLQFNK